MRFVLEVVAKVEAAKMDGGVQYTLQCRLHVEHDGEMAASNEPQMLAMAVPEAFWRSVEVGAELSFPQADA